ALLKGDGAVDVDAAHGSVRPDSVAKILLTSGSTSAPKGVPTTHRMMCTNQTMIADALPFVAERPPVLVDWLPWNHVFGGSHNFNLVLANGGTLYIDDGKPVPALVGRTIENLSMVSPTLSFNVPLGFAQLLPALERDAALRARYFGALDMIFYAGASLPEDVWAGLARLARAERGDVPLMTSSWGLTETAPAALIQHEPTDRPGIVGVPMTGLEVKLVPDSAAPERFEVRVRGESVFTGYLNAPDKTAAAFDDEGFFITGDAMRFVTPGAPDRGLRFDGRIAEDFKLTSGTWVRAGELRLEVLGSLGGLAQDVVVAGADRDEIGILIFPNPEALQSGGFRPEKDNGALRDAGLAEAIADRLAARFAAASGSASRVARALVLADPPDMGAGEITAKGNLNPRRVLDLRAALVERLYDDADPATILVKGMP
ncbi:MAG: feruloyl-CoA synthetase, partial [Alphaproteobacteria bacterium]